MLSAALVSSASCFGGEFVQGLPCEVDDDCGAALICIESVCGGVGGDSLCGNALLERDEECDDGNTVDGDDCTSTCRDPICGDGLVAAGEECDDGNTVDGDACTSVCSVPVCGDGLLGPGEDCDYGEDIPFDDCPSSCKYATCGNGVVEVGEACDDGNADNTDTCTTVCRWPTCDDGLRSQDESDVDCGGSCDPCEIGQWCNDGPDCLGGLCANDQCIEHAVEIAAGDAHTCVRLNTGKVRCWGSNAVGQLGYGTPETIGDDEVPSEAGTVDVDISSAEQIGAGRDHTCVVGFSITEGGGRTGEIPATWFDVQQGISCWGKGEHGRLGYGNTQNIGDDETPASVGLLPLGLAASPIGATDRLMAGARHTCLLAGSGSIGCWGAGEFGQLGYASTSDIGDDETLDTLPQGGVETLDYGVLIAGGGDHSCSVSFGGYVRCWGRAAEGQLGYGNTENIGDDEPPSAVGHVDVGWSATGLAAGDRHTCAIVAGNQLRCWGANDFGQLGLGHTETIGDDELPADVAYVDLGVAPALSPPQLVAGANHTCALYGGAVYCWGANESGQLGYGHTDTIGDDEAPGDAGVVDLQTNAIAALAAGSRHTCALTSDGEVYCWGANESGQLGYGHTETIGDDEVGSWEGPVPCLLP